MKKLNLLEPNVVTGYLNEGAGEKVKYLKISDSIDLKALESDVAAGAVQFKDCLEAAQKGLSKVVVVRATNEEEGLMAINYLAGIRNKNGNTTCNASSGIIFENTDDDEISVSVDWDHLLEDEYILDFDYEDDEEDSDWEESPSKIPIISFAEVQSFGGNVFPVFQSDFVMAGRPNTRNKKPYWMTCTKESICVVVDLKQGMFGPFGNADLSEVLERFQSNKCLYVLIIEHSYNSEAEELSDQGNSWVEQPIFKYVLETTADVILAKARENQLEEYRLVQFDNWAKRLGITFEKRFSKKSIVDSIVKLNNKEKSKLFKMVLKYIKKESRKAEGETFGKEDFKILNKFKILGFNTDNSKSYQERFEKDLVGMEKVKEQIRGIIEVMKYNQCRENMGIGKSDFHNVHLLIGAPGTAKTTVAKMMGNMMKEENLLPGNRFICVNGADLKGMFVGHSAPKTHQIFVENDIILIDEAYSLAAGDRGEVDSFSQEAIAQLILEIEEHAMDKLIMFAGYGGTDISQKDNKMKQFIDANPGLKSRINSTIYFESYTPQQMVDIVHVQAQIQKVMVDKKADAAILQYFEGRVSDRNFGNGREARSLLENALVFTASRVMKLPENKRTKTIMNTISCEDVMKAIEKMRENTMQQNGKEKSSCGFLV